ncbi:MAG: magnesium chelatase family protein [Planctomycetota bacterium]|jgi:magnesium chelatase family protein
MAAELVTVEARFEGHDRSSTDVVISGLPDPVIRESRGRLICALKENGLRLPTGTLYLNLVPASRRKVGGMLDLAIALGAAAACRHLDASWLRDTLFIGELGIDGRLHPVPGGLAAAACARDLGLKRVIASRATASEAAWIGGLPCYGADRLAQVVSHLSGAGTQLARIEAHEVPVEDTQGPSLDDVRGQDCAKRALAIAALGAHGLLFIGPPGAGKSMLARRLIGLLPEATRQERIEITLALSAAGQWPGGLVRARPFRAPHHTTSYAGLVGGGSPPRPGEISLAHNGLLFLDELPEFRREALEALREPLETGTISISRAGGRCEFPARFQLAAAMNPCPCGYSGHQQIICRCSPPMIERYRRRISGPLLDRIDLRIELVPPPIEELLNPHALRSVPEESRQENLEAAVDQGVERARARQGERPNALLDTDDLNRLAALDDKSRSLIEAAAKSRSFSARALQSLRRVSRSVADLAGDEVVTADHLAQAIALRAALSGHS